MFITVQSKILPLPSLSYFNNLMLTLYHTEMTTTSRVNSNGMFNSTWIETPRKKAMTFEVRVCDGAQIVFAKKRVTLLSQAICL